MVSGYNRGGVTTHAPSGDGNTSLCQLYCVPAVTIHAPSGDGNRMTIDNCWSKLGYNPRPVRGRKLCFDLTPYPYSKSYNPRPVRGRKSPVAPHCTQPEELQSTPRQGTEIFKTSSSVFGKPGYNPRPVRGRKLKNFGTT